MTTAINILDEIIGQNRYGGTTDYSMDAEKWLLEAKSRIQALGDGWIPVSERLPENGQKVIVYLSPREEGVEGDIKDARYFSDTLGIRFRVGAGEFVHGMYVKHKHYIQIDTDEIVYQLTHWQPLPLPPNK